MLIIKALELLPSCGSCEFERFWEGIFISNINEKRKVSSTNHSKVSISRSTVRSITVLRMEKKIEILGGAVVPENYIQFRTTWIAPNRVASFYVLQKQLQWFNFVNSQINFATWRTFFKFCFIKIRIAVEGYYLFDILFDMFLCKIP